MPKDMQLQPSVTEEDQAWLNMAPAGRVFCSPNASRHPEGLDRVPSILRDPSTLTDQAASSPRACDTLETAKALTDLDDLVSALRRSIPASKPWQRTLLDQLTDADRQIQILRMMISLERSRHELRVAATGLQDALAVANVQILKSRADVSTKMAVKLASGLARKISEAFRAASMRSD